MAEYSKYYTELFNVNDALITRVDHPYLEVFKASENEDNLFDEGDRVMLAGHYCEKVIKGKRKFKLDDARQSNHFAKYPEVNEGLISYLGYPLQWPDGEVYGTLCVHNDTPGQFSIELENLMKRLQELINSQLKNIYQKEELKEKIAEVDRISGDLKKSREKFMSIYKNIEQGICLHEVIYEKE
ncbi:MAG: GAF domain-containing protein, partial [Halanaerobiales bacterium]